MKLTQRSKPASLSNRRSSAHSTSFVITGSPLDAASVVASFTLCRRIAQSPASPRQDQALVTPCSQRPICQCGACAAPPGPSSCYAARRACGVQTRRVCRPPPRPKRAAKSRHSGAYPSDSLQAFEGSPDASLGSRRLPLYGFPHPCPNIPDEAE